MAGRPKKKAADRRDDVLRIRLTEAERKQLDRAAVGKGLDVSAWARMLLLREAQGSPPSVGQAGRDKD